MLVVLVGGILLMKADVTGYDAWLPDEGELEAVDVAAYSSREMLSEPENIAAVRRLAEIGVAMTAADDAAPEGELQAQFGPFDDSFGITLKFRLNGGRMAARYYRLPQTEEVEALLVQLQTSAEYKQKKWDLFCLDDMTEDEVAVLMFTDNAGAYLGNLYDEPEKISQILETLREEELARQESSMPVFRLELAYENRRDGSWSASWSKIYVCEADTRTQALIKQLTGYEPQPQALTADQISMVEIGYVVQRDEEGTAWRNVTVTDAGDIEKLLEDAVYADAMNIYNSVFYLGSGAPLMESADTVNVYATLKDGDRTTELRYLLGTLPTDVIEKYRPDGAADEAAAVIDAAATAEIMPSVAVGRRDFCGAAVLLLYLLCVGLVTGPSLYQLLAGSLPEPRFELIPFADIAAVLNDPASPAWGCSPTSQATRRCLRRWGSCCRCSGGILGARGARFCSASAYRSA